MNRNTPDHVSVRVSGLFFIAAMGVGLVWILIAPPRASAATFTVTKTADTNDGVCNTDCSLREAIIAANTNPGPDSITVPNGIYTLTIPGVGEDAAAIGDLDILGDVTITGSGATIINGGGLGNRGNGLDRVFNITSTVSVVLSNLTIAGGSAGSDYGGGIGNRGSLTISNSVIKDNTADRGGGISNYGTLTVTNSTLYFNLGASYGGGIYNTNTASLTLNSSTLQMNSASSQGGGIFSELFVVMSISNSTISNNGANSGGGISGGAVVTITNSTISGNSAGSSGNGGGIYSLMLLTLVNTTLSGNWAWGNGGGIAGGGTINLNNVTITGNTANYGSHFGGQGGGIYLNPAFLVALNLKNTILAGNAVGIGGQYPDCSGTLTSQDYNLIQDTTGCALTGTIAHVITGTAPLLGPLQNNGGPTWTHALLPGSPAIDAGNPALPGSGGNACAATDQRGVARPVGATCDIGAYEGVARFLFLPLILR